MARRSSGCGCGLSESPGAPLRGTRCPPVGQRVIFAPTPSAVAAFYTDRYSPRSGMVGSVVAIPVPGGRKTCMMGPRGGLIYVEWDDFGVSGVFRADLVRAR